MATSLSDRALAVAKSASENIESTVSMTADQPWSPSLVIALSAILAGITLIAIFIAGFLLNKKSSDSSEILKTLGIIFIIGLSSILLVVGYNKDQLTPIIGLFGAIAGYLLGRESRPSKVDL